MLVRDRSTVYLGTGQVLGCVRFVHTLFYTTGIAASAKLHPNVGPYYR